LELLSLGDVTPDVERLLEGQAVVSLFLDV
jgi:hypothetical protein